jgi:hypothetical protein
MEIKTNIGVVMAGRIAIFSVIVFLIIGCSDSEECTVHFVGIHPSEHTLLVISPDFTIKSLGDTLNKNYPQLRTGKVFPLTGLLRVGDEVYRFMGGDSLRISSVASLSSDSAGWSGRYSYLFPGKGWERKDYDDSWWSEGESAFGPMAGKYPVHTLWGADNIYVRRHVFIDNEDILKEHKVYIRYVCDDQMKLYCNGYYCFGKNFTPQVRCQQLSDGAVAKIHNGDNIFAVYGRNTGGPALLDFGLYVENKTYSDADTATLKQMDVQATQTHYIFQCGEVELQLDFVSPSLSERWNMEGWPVGFLSYQIHTEVQKQQNIEILFDVDTEWMSGNNETDSWVENGWKIVKSDNLYISTIADGTQISSDDGHVILSQKLHAGNENRGVLLLGYEEGRIMQYEGENLFPLWNKDGRREIKELLKSVGDRYLDIRDELDKLDAKWNMKLMQTDDKLFAGQMLLSYRDFASSHRLVASSEYPLFCFGDTLGNVREAYESFPSLLTFNRIDWMKGLLNPVFEYCKNPYYTKRYPPYDMGLYPIINKQEKLETCSEEAAANILMMTAVVVETEKDFSYAALHWDLLCLWADFLQDKMDKKAFSSDKLLDKYDKQVKCVLGLMAFRKLVQMKEVYG